MSKEPLNDNYSIKVGKKNHDIKMTHGLLNEVVRAIGDIDGIAEISFDTDLRNSILNEIFAERDDKGRIKEDVNLFNLDVKPDDVALLLEWVGSHALDFLLNLMTRTKGQIDSNQSRIQALMPTSPGSPA